MSFDRTRAISRLRSDFESESICRIGNGTSWTVKRPAISIRHVPEASTRLPSVKQFEFDLATPFFKQLLEVFESLGISRLDPAHIKRVDQHQGIYGLFKGERLVYIGKAGTSLRKRLGEHRFKISGRQNITPDQLNFRAVYLARTWGPLAPEAMMIEHFKKKGLCEWNNNGFGQHDPGRVREETNKPPGGFDGLYPIRLDWPCSEIPSGEIGVNLLLQNIKRSLPFTFRYETDSPKGWKKGSKKYNSKTVSVPAANMPASKLIGLVARSLGPTWQATAFPSHVILYDENVRYSFGTIL